jgi:hypothetical protein
LLRDKFGGCPVYWPFGVRHGGDVSLICGCRMEREKACPDSAARCDAGGEREWSKRKNREGLSTDAGRAGGPARSSDEPFVMKVE